MLIHLHKQATTTPKVRAAIQASAEPASVLAERFGTTEQTVCKWRHRESVHDRSHTPHRLQTTLTAAQEAITFNAASFPTCYGKEFTDRLFASRARAPSGEHEFDQLCAELGIEHRLTPPKSLQTNGMVERFNGRISDVLKTNRFDSALDLEQTLMRYVHLYNTQLPQSALRSRTPMQAMKDWHKSHPQLFVKSPRNHAGRDR